MALLFTRGIGSRGAAQLVEYFGSAEALFAASRSTLLNDVGLNEEYANRILAMEGMEQAKREIAYCRKHNIMAIAATDKEYPAPLREIADRPHVLFVKGSIESLNMRTLSMVGTREMSPSAEHVCDTLISGLARNIDKLCIVSGLAYGIDGACHRSALRHNVATIGVVAQPLPNISPAPHRQLAEDIIKHGGAIVSELSSQSPHNGKLFIARNRIIAGMSMGIVIVESPATGGSLSTANLADGYNRTVMAVPGRISDPTSFGTNNLIRSGKARLVLTANDIIEDMDWCAMQPHQGNNHATEDNKIAELTPQQRTVLDAISSSTTISLEELLACTSMTLGELSMTILDLEMEGYVRCLPGKRYERV